MLFILAFAVLVKVFNSFSTNLARIHIFSKVPSKFKQRSQITEINLQNHNTPIKSRPVKLQILQPQQLYEKKGCEQTLIVVTVLLLGLIIFVLLYHMSKTNVCLNSRGL